jgi:hypothetical protein
MIKNDRSYFNIHEWLVDVDIETVRKRAVWMGSGELPSLTGMKNSETIFQEVFGRLASK